MRAAAIAKPQPELHHLGLFLTGRGPGQSRLRYRLGTNVGRQYEPLDSMLYLESGWVKAAAIGASGKETVIALRGPGELLGTRCLIPEHRRVAALTTLTDCCLIRISKTAVLGLFEQEPGFAETFAMHLVRQSLRVQRRLLDQLTKSAEQQLANMLLELAGNSADNEQLAVPTRVNQQDLAGLLGTTRSRISYFMNKLRRQEIIDYDRQGHVTVHRARVVALID